MNLTGQALREPGQFLLQLFEQVKRAPGNLPEIPVEQFPEGRYLYLPLLLSLLLLLAACDTSQFAGSGNASSSAPPAPARTTAPKPVSSGQQAEGSTGLPSDTQAPSPTQLAQITPEVAAIASVQSAIDTQGIKTSCEQFTRYIQETGVKDDEGNAHPGVVGWTDANVEIVYNYTYTGTVSHDTGQACLQTEALNVEFRVKTRITRLEWVSPEPISTRCQAEKERWSNEVLQHEREHEQDVTETVRAAGDKWKEGRSYAACAATEQEARQGLEEKIKADVDAELAGISGELEQRAEQFHAAPEGAGTEGIGCGVCR